MCWYDRTVLCSCPPANETAVVGHEWWFASLWRGLWMVPCCVLAGSNAFELASTRTLAPWDSGARAEIRVFATGPVTGRKKRSRRVQGRDKWFGRRTPRARC